MLPRCIQGRLRLFIGQSASSNRGTLRYNNSCVSHIENRTLAGQSTEYTAVNRFRTTTWNSSVSLHGDRPTRPRLSKDDEAEEVIDTPNTNEAEEESWLEEGEFFDTPFHQDRKIRRRDVGKKITVGEAVIQELNSLFGFSRPEALNLVRSPHFLLVADGAVIKTLYFLKENDIPAAQLKRIPWILLRPEDDLKGKFSKLTEPFLFKNYSDGLGFCHFSKDQIRKWQKLFAMESANFLDHPNRLYHLADRLRVPIAHITEKVIKPKRILFMEMERIENIINILERYGVQSEDIISDLWVFYHNPQTTEERLKAATEAGCQRPKLWMCRCPDYIFNRTCERYQSSKEVLGGKTMTEYLAERLECDEEFIQNYAKGNPGLKTVHISKVKSQIDLLYSEGFTSEQIRASMRILLYAEKRTAERINKLKEIGHFPTSVTVLYKTPRQFESFYQSLLHYYKRIANS